MSNTRTHAGAIGAVRLRSKRFIAIAAVIATLVTGTIMSHDAAWATEYPTWSDVAAVRNDEAATKNKIAQIEKILASLKAEAARTQADAEAKGLIWQEADLKFQDAAFKAGNLQEQADAADAVATESEQRAGQWAAQLVRSGGGDFTANLFANEGDADDLLYGLGLSSKISGQAYTIYESALVARNTAQSLTDQADVAKKELEQLKLIAEKAFNEAQAASNAAAAALEEQLANQAQLEAQLIVLKQRRAATEADYLAGVRERIGTGASLDAGEISLTGWARPAAGRITDSFGPRIHPVYGGYSFHRGTDIGAGCGQNIYAASGGTVIYAGWNGGYGNFVLIDHGGGIATAYGHIKSGGTLVRYGQSVDVGTNIAKVGTTGSSTGCHLHFEVRINGTAVNSVPFMANQGITIG